MKSGSDGGRNDGPWLSVAIVCKNNEATIGRTLESVRGLADEIVAVDSGSTDGTIRLLEGAGARVIRSAWLGHVKTKQLALESCSGAWVLSLDSDEALEEELRESVRGFISQRKGNQEDKSGVMGAEVNRRTFYRGRGLRRVWQPEWRLRLVRKGAAGWGGLDPHDKLELGRGISVRLKGDLRHDSFVSFEEHFKKQAQHASTMARSLYAAGKRGSYMRLMVSPMGALVKQLIVKGGIVDGYAGVLAGVSTAAAALIKHAVLIELSRGERVGGGTK